MLRAILRVVILTALAVGFVLALDSAMTKQEKAERAAAAARSGQAATRAANIDRQGWQTP